MFGRQGAAKCTPNPDILVEFVEFSRRLITKWRDSLSSYEPRLKTPGDWLKTKNWSINKKKKYASTIDQ